MSSARIAIVGDVHELWDPVFDAGALKFLNVDIVLFVGDFGNQNVDLVLEIAGLEHEKAVILGNHDAWTLRDPHASREPILAQLRALGDHHIGWSSKTIKGKHVTVLGARPFSWGGKSTVAPGFFLEHFKVKTMQDSTARILAAAAHIPAHHPIILMGHNGPSGLGSRPDDICGVDFKPQAGDLGDLDMRAALDHMLEAGRRVPLVLFGHMHEELNHRGPWAGGKRRRLVRDRMTGTVYLNAAVVPRIKRWRPPQPQQQQHAWQQQQQQQEGGSGDTGQQEEEEVLDPYVHVHHFCVVELQGGQVVVAKDVWVMADEGAGPGTAQGGGLGPTDGPVAPPAPAAAAAAAAASTCGDDGDDSDDEGHGGPGAATAATAATAIAPPSLGLAGATVVGSGAQGHSLSNAGGRQQQPHPQAQAQQQQQQQQQQQAQQQARQVAGGRRYMVAWERDLLAAFGN